MSELFKLIENHHKTRMHPSRMRTVGCSGCFGEGVCGGECLPGGEYLPEEGVCPGGYLLRGVFCLGGGTHPPLNKITDKYKKLLLRTVIIFLD